MRAPSFAARPESAIPVRFFAFGLLGFVALSAGVAALPAAVAVPPGPRGILLLHLAVLGWITPVMMGADYQLIPVVLHRPLVAPAVAGPIFWGFAAGVTVFLGGWAWERDAWIAVGGTAAGICLLAFCAQMALTLGRLRAGGATAVGLAGGIACLAAVAVLGPWMALGVGGALPPPGRALLALHAAAGLAGWLLLTILGAGYALVPFFAATPPAVRPTGAPAAMGAAAGGVLLLLASAAWAPLALAGAALGLAALTIGASDLLRLARHGRQARREPATRYTLAAAAALWLAAGGAGAALAGVDRLAAPAAYLGLVAGPSLLILGQLQKILPFIAALDASRAAKGRGKVPKTEALFPRRRAFAILWALLPGYAAVTAGLGLAAPPLVRAGAGVALAAAVAFAAQQGAALAAWRRARAASPHPPPA